MQPHYVKLKYELNLLIKAHLIIHLDVKFIASELGKFEHWKWFFFPEESVICDSDVLLDREYTRRHKKVR